MQVLPHVDFFGRCEEAVEFYKAALGAEVEVLHRYSDLPEFHNVPDELGHKVLLATLKIGEGRLTCGDVILEPIRYSGYSILLVVDSVEQAEALSTALTHGEGEVHFEMTETAQEDLAHGVIDQFGVRWYFHVQT